jgi:hypothetical protein
MGLLMKRICGWCTLALLLPAFVPAARAAGPPSPKPAETTSAGDPWASFGPESWVLIRSTRLTDAKGKKDTSIVETKITVIAKAPDKVTLENAFTFHGQTTTSRFDQPLTGGAESLPAGMKVLSRGTDTLTIAGQPVHCETLEATMNEGGEYRFKRWTSVEVPGSLVRSVSSSKGGLATAEVVGFKVH